MNKETDDASQRRRAIRDQIDENLKRAYSATVNEEIPDRFRDLLSQLKPRDTPDKDGTQ